MMLMILMMLINGAATDDDERNNEYNDHDVDADDVSKCRCLEAPMFIIGEDYCCDD